MKERERMPDHKEMLKRIKRIEIKTARIVNDYMAGQYHSVFKGRGIEFDEVREYTIGDDVRSMDWNVSARYGHPFIKRFREERELTVMLMVDISSSKEFGTKNKLKGELAVEICALLAFSAIKNNDKVGLIIFTDIIEKYIPPKKGKNHILRIIRELLYFKPKKKKTDIKNALDYLNRVQRKKSVLFLISDFIDEERPKEIEITNRKHDLIAVTINDPREYDLPPVGILELEDAETGEVVLIDTYDKSTIEHFKQNASEKHRARDTFFRKHKVDFINVSTDKDYVNGLVAFFRRRARRV